MMILSIYGTGHTILYILQKSSTFKSLVLQKERCWNCNLFVRENRIDWTLIRIMFLTTMKQTHVLHISPNIMHAHLPLGGEHCTTCIRICTVYIWCCVPTTCVARASLINLAMHLVWASCWSSYYQMGHQIAMSRSQDPCMKRGS